MWLRIHAISIEYPREVRKSFSLFHDSRLASLEKQHPRVSCESKPVSRWSSDQIMFLCVDQGETWAHWSPMKMTILHPNFSSHFRHWNVCIFYAICTEYVPGYPMNWISIVSITNEEFGSMENVTVVFMFFKSSTMLGKCALVTIITDYGFKEAFHRGDPVTQLVAISRIDLIWYIFLSLMISFLDLNGILNISGTFVTSSLS